MQIILNGKPLETSANTLLSLAQEQLEQHDNIAIAHNFTIVPQSLWASTTLAEKDKIEIVNAIVGG